MGFVFCFLKVILMLGGIFFVAAGLRDTYRDLRDKGYVRKDVTGEEDMQEISTIDQRIREFVLEAMDYGRNCLEIMKVLVLTRYNSYKYPLKMAFQDRIAIRAKAATLACMRSAISQSRRFINRHPVPRVVLAAECFREALRLCQGCSRYTLGKMNSAQCPVYQYFVEMSSRAEFDKNEGR
jgi:hypothetical protein